MNTNQSEKSKIALITGSSRGLGRSTALNMAGKGMDIIVTYNSHKEEAEKVVSEIEKMGRKAFLLKLNVGDIKSLGQFAIDVKAVLNKHWGCEHFNFLVNNAGSALHMNFMKTTEEQFDVLMNEHFKGVYFLTQKLVPLIADGGRIVNISSGLARFSFAGSSAYAAMKGAVEVLTRYLAKELGSRKIAVNTVAPGAIETDFGDGYLRNNDTLKALITDQTALGRHGLPDDIGAMIASLVSDDNKWVNGQRIEVSGGMYL